jgi:hypothetical protein
MPKQWNEETGEWDYLPDPEGQTEGADSEPRRAVTGLETVQAVTVPASHLDRPEGTGKTGKERQAAWRARHPGKHRQYMLDYMRRYRARRANPPHQDGPGTGLTE